MKRCPECLRDYYDDTLLYCLDDGSSLLEGPASQPGEAVSGSPPVEAQTVIIHDTTPREPATYAQALTTEQTAILPHATPDSSGKPSKTTSLSASRGAKLVVAAILAALVIAGGFFAYRYSSLSNSKQIESIAVMPFVNDNGAGDVDYLSDGMTEMLISSLTQLPELTVKARSSVFRYKGKDTDPKKLGRELNVQAILSGRVTQRADELTISLELVDAATENAIWSKQYSKKHIDLLSLQSEIVRDVSGILRSKLSGTEVATVERKYTTDSQAYQLYLIGRFHWNRRTKIDMYKAIDHYQRAVQKDPNYALAFSGLADAFVILQGYDKAASPLETQLKAREYALKALSLDDSLSEAHVSTAFVLQNVDFDFIGAEREFRRAIELDPKNGMAHSYLALLLTGLGRADEAETLFRRALELEPASANINRNYGIMLMLARQYDASEQQLRKTVELDPTFQLGYLSLANTLHVQSKYAEAAETYAKSREVAGELGEAASMRASYARGGWRQFIEDFERKDWISNLRPKYLDAMRWASIGETAKALDALDKAYEERESFLLFVKVDPRFDTIRDEPRYKVLMNKMGFSS
jgi:TolB-like protein/Tfp pilus assembly protein PilF